MSRPHGKLVLPALSLLVALALAAWAMSLSAFVRDIATVPPNLPTQPLDAIVTLTGGSNRLDNGFDLLEHELGKKLFVSGVYRGTEVRQLLKRWKAEPQNRLDCCVVLGFEADNTSGNAVETVRWLRKEGFRSFYLVTANYHIKRAMLEFNRIDPTLQITPYPVIPDSLDLQKWWQDGTSRSLILREYAKYTAARFRSVFL